MHSVKVDDQSQQAAMWIGHPILKRTQDHKLSCLPTQNLRSKKIRKTVTIKLISDTEVDDMLDIEVHGLAFDHEHISNDDMLNCELLASALLASPAFMHPGINVKMTN